LDKTLQFPQTTVGLLERASKRGETMHQVRSIIVGVLLLQAGVAFGQSNAIATGNMHFDAKDMDTNGDHMITRDEMVAYAAKQWDLMAQGKDTIPIDVAAKDFATGGVNFKAHAIDTDHDGTISKEEFVAYAGRKFDSMKKTDNMVSVDDMARAISRGNTENKMSPH
jgi:EF hand